MEFLRDPLWQFISFIIALIALGFSILIYLKQRSIKSISYEIISNTPVFSIEEEVKDKIQVLFNGKRIDDARLVVLRLWNSGNAPILSSDFEWPIEFDFGEKAEILDAAILETTPESINASINISSESFTLTPILLNKGDKITLKALLSNFNEDLKVNTRIVGITKINESTYDPNIRKVLAILFSLLIVELICITSLFIAILFRSLIFALIFAVSFLICLIFILIDYIIKTGILFRKRSNKKYLS